MTVGRTPSPPLGPGRRSVFSPSRALYDAPGRSIDGPSSWLLAEIADEALTPQTAEMRTRERSP